MKQIDLASLTRKTVMDAGDVWVKLESGKVKLIRRDPGLDCGDAKKIANAHSRGIIVTATPIGHAETMARAALEYLGFHCETAQAHFRTLRGLQ